MFEIDGDEAADLNKDAVEIDGADYTILYIAMALFIIVCVVLLISFIKE